MKQVIIEKMSEELHNIWCGWAKILMKEESLSTKRTKRWAKLFIPYAKLSERMKNLDRKFIKQLLKKGGLL